MARVKEYKRTCERCGQEWYVPKKIAKGRPPSRLTQVGAKIGSYGTIGDTRHLRIQAEVQRHEDAGRCPGCGSSSFSQAKA